MNFRTFAINTHTNKSRNILPIPWQSAVKPIFVINQKNKRVMSRISTHFAISFFVLRIVVWNSPQSIRDDVTDDTSDQCPTGSSINICHAHEPKIVEFNAVFWTFILNQFDLYAHTTTEHRSKPHIDANSRTRTRARQHRCDRCSECCCSPLNRHRHALKQQS